MSKLDKALRKVNRVLSYGNPVTYAGEKLRHKYIGGKAIKRVLAKYMTGSSSGFSYSNSAYTPRTISQLTTH